MAAIRVLRWSRRGAWMPRSAKPCRSMCEFGEASQQMQRYNLERLYLSRNAFGIAFDIDGVLIQGSETIERAPEALRRLYKDVDTGKLQVPYVFLTNGGGMTEAARAKELTRQLSVPVNPIQVHLGHTPFKTLAQRYRGKKVLSLGKGEPETALTSYGFSTVVKMDNYFREFPHIDPLLSYKPWAKYESNANGMLMPEIERQIAAVFVCSDPVDWSRDIQVLCDVLRAGGYPGKLDSQLPQPSLYFAADDFEYSTKFPVPRFGMGAFRIALESLYVKLIKRPLLYTSYGKPKPIVYHLAAKSLHRIAGMMYSKPGMNSHSEEDPNVGPLELPLPVDRARQEGALKTLYMIGDNPETDIAGAIGAGRPWYSILVRSGNFRGGGNHDKYPADKVVDNVYEAVDFVLKKEGIWTK
ncbi:mitochondrial hydrolase YKR070W [Physcomitrium patens]|uniref:Uncharacterized protein n=1 Tax=Physcomitrium patens TaxID=3218 RepID=A0A2K1J7T2_PHYPA|nr:uncharacterized protein YKR070W-like [Physcomitrium patens]XP_024399136.1 uncharacterized protein YKR070W-like [Physcomitrium patens]XP_024399137.1 uncharacterized protein YKR070W-like [Physcomitrium patens]PNR37578.1 hypothetical protein PHYPA_020687 [Physcomitrium patens]|eukprot:XP_024399135.1 uncharacterized protein YKR070W-like [Physcomitrella patens]